MATYNPSIPNAGDLLSTSQQNIKDNFTKANSSFGTDHYAFNDGTANNGRHKDIHIVKRVGNAAAVSGIYTVFSKDYTPDTAGGVADTQLFGITQNGGVSQLSGNSSATDGWFWSGGLLIQWGIVTLPGSSNPNGTVTFKNRVAGAIPFPNNCFNVNVSLQANVKTSQANTIAVLGTPSTTSFSWFFTGSTSYDKFYWVAIGN